MESLDEHRHNLPVQLTSFIGWEEEIAEVAGLLSTARLITLAGAAGIGDKAQEIGATVIENYADGVWFVGLSDPKMLQSHAAEIFDVGEAALHGFLRGNRS